MKNTIYYCLFYDGMSGGHRIGMEHVHFLKEAGFDVSVVVPGGKIEWFKYKNFETIDYPEFFEKVLPEDWLMFCGIITDLPVIQEVKCNKLYLIQHYIYGESLYFDLEGEAIVGADVLQDYFIKYYDKVVDCIPFGIRTKDFAYDGKSKKNNKVVAIRHNLWKGFIDRAVPDLYRQFDFDLLEKLSEDEVKQKLGEANIYVHLTAFEGFGLLPLEAMLKKAIVISCTEGLGKYAIDGVTYIKAKPEVDDIIKCVRRVVDNRLTHDKMRQTAYEIALKYDWEHKKDRVIEFWKDKLNV